MTSYPYYQTAPHAKAASISLALLDIIAVSLKFWTRKYHKQPLQADDWLLVPATIFTVALAAAVTYGAQVKALGWPVEIPPGYTGDPSKIESDQVITARKIQYFYLIGHPIAAGLTKLSFLFMYNRIFSIKFNKTITFFMCLIGGWTISFFFAELFQCRTNWEANWGSTHVFRTQCNKTLWILFAVCFTGFVLDLMIIIIPIPFIWRLAMTTGRKLAVLSIFLLASGTLVASLLRFGLLLPNLWRPFTFNERFLALTTSMYWGMVEAGVGIFVACLTTLQQLVRTSVARTRTKLSTERSSNSRSRPNMLSNSKSSSKHGKIQVNQAVDIVHGPRDSNPILGESETWVYHSNRSDEGAQDIEMRGGIGKTDAVEARSAY